LSEPSARVVAQRIASVPTWVHVVTPDRVTVVEVGAAWFAAVAATSVWVKVAPSGAAANAYVSSAGAFEVL
jgi:CO dehydrogenase/acetyl-CoA synthase beta subunit